MSFAAPQNRVITMSSPGQGTAATDDAWNIARAPYAGKATKVTYAAEAAITGHAANNRVLSLINKKQDGSGTTVIATLTTTANLAADDEVEIPLSETAADLVIAEGDILEWNSDAQASGVADPGGLVSIYTSRTL